jgi:hypothetical protein
MGIMNGRRQSPRKNWLARLVRGFAALGPALDTFSAPRKQQGSKQVGEIQEESPFQAALDHLVRSFEAEQEVRRRLAEEAKLMLTVTVAFLGLAIFRFGLEAQNSGFPTNPHWLGSLIRGCLISGLLCLVTSCAVILFKARRIWGLEHGTPSPASLLFPDAELIDGLKEPPRGTSEHVRYHALLKTLAAAYDLWEQNGHARWRVAIGRRLFVSGLALILVGVSLYLGWYTPAGKSSRAVTGQPAAARSLTQRPPGSDHAPD